MPKTTKTKPVRMPLFAWEMLSSSLQDDSMLLDIRGYLDEIKDALVEILQRNQRVHEKVSRRNSQRLTKAEVAWLAKDINFFIFIIDGAIKDILQCSFEHNLVPLALVIVGMRGTKKEREMRLERYEDEVNEVLNYVRDVLDVRRANLERAGESGFDPDGVGLPGAFAKIAETLCGDIDQLWDFLQGVARNSLYILDLAGVDTSNLPQTELPPGFQEPEAFSVVTAISDPALNKHAGSIVKKALRYVKDSGADFPLVEEITPSILLVKNLPDVNMGAGYTFKSRQVSVISIPPPQVITQGEANCIRDSDTYLAHAVTHEIGHMLWVLLPEKSRRTWQEAYSELKRQIASGDREHPTSYYLSTHNEEEGFCEIFASLFWDAESEQLSDLQETIREILSST